MELEGPLHNLPAPLSRVLKSAKKLRAERGYALFTLPERLPRAVVGWDPELLDLAICDYQDGATALEIATGMGVGRQAVLRALHNAGVDVRMQPLTETEIDECVRLYQSGLSILQVAAATGRSRGSVQRFLHTAGVDVRPKRKRLKLTDTQLEQVCQLYRGGLSTAVIGKRFGIGAETVRRALQREGVRLRPAPGAG